MKKYTRTLLILVLIGEVTTAATLIWLAVPVLRFVLDFLRQVAGGICAA